MIAPYRYGGGHGAHNPYPNEHMGAESCLHMFSSDRTTSEGSVLADGDVFQPGAVPNLVLYGSSAPVAEHTPFPLVDMGQDETLFTRVLASEAWGAAWALATQVRRGGDIECSTWRWYTNRQIAEEVELYDIQNTAGIPIAKLPWVAADRLFVDANASQAGEAQYCAPDHSESGSFDDDEWKMIEWTPPLGSPPAILMKIPLQ